jgi:hypothetical protein
MPRIQSPRYQWGVSSRNVLWVTGWAGGLWLTWLSLRAGKLILALLLLLLSLGLLWGRAGTSIISAFNRFCLNPSTPVTIVANPLSWGCYLFGYNLFLTIISAIFVAFPTMKYLGASSIGGLARAGPWILFLFAPVSEELIWRLPLRYTEVNLTISALLVTLFTVRRLLLKSEIFSLITRWLWSALFAILVAPVVFVLLRTEPVSRLASRIWQDHFRSVVYVSCFAFGLLHISNFRFTTLTSETSLLAPLLVLPQMISGFVFAFARMRLGMISCIVLHAATNLLAFWLFQIKPR